MAKVITFSRVFPAYHPKAGQPTYFVEKVLPSFREQFTSDVFKAWKYKLTLEFLESLSNEKFDPKHHTIRSGNRFKAGDYFSPRVWSGKPYRSKQIIIAPDIKIQSVFDFCIDPFDGEYRMNGIQIPFEKIKEISVNDGFVDLDDFELWFKVRRSFGFSGQIICWNKEINY